MQYALLGGRRVKASPGLRARCATCGGKVIARTGEINIWHFAHESLKDCDQWHEGETDWHRVWKELVPEDWREFNFISHRADIYNKNLLKVIELQHSPISPEEIRERESFYVNMIWLFDARKYTLRRRPRLDTEDAACYVWKRKRRNIIDNVTKPLFFDLGGFVLYVKRILNYFECRVWGIPLTYEVFTGLYLR